MEEQKRNPAAGLSESEQVQVRRQKLADLQAAGNDPFTLTKFPQDAYSADLKEEFKELPNETDSGKLVALAGRMMSKRVMGKASFAHLRDDKGDIQLYVRRDSGLGFTALKADSISRASTHVLDPTKLRAGMHYYTFSTVDSLETIRYIAFAKSLTDYAVIDLTGDTINAYEFNKPITLKKKYTEGVLNSSLWNVIKANGGDPYLAIKISDVYAWQIDFFDIKDGDSFKVLYNEAYIDDTTALSIASIEGAIFTLLRILQL